MTELPIIYKPKMVRLTLNTLKQMLQDFYLSTSDHFGTLCVERLTALEFPWILLFASLL